jgi:hypothetical protein
MHEINPNDPVIIIVLFAMQCIWGLFLIVLTAAMRRILKDIEENTKATSGVAQSVNAINVLLSGSYVMRPDFDRLEKRLREGETKITELLTIVSMRRTGAIGD